MGVLERDRRARVRAATSRLITLTENGKRIRKNDGTIANLPGATNARGRVRPETDDLTATLLIFRVAAAFSQSRIELRYIALYGMKRLAMSGKAGLEGRPRSSYASTVANS